MTAAELIHELQQHPPGKEVRVCLRNVTTTTEQGNYVAHFSAEEADAADEVRNEGAFLLIWGGKP